MENLAAFWDAVYAGNTQQYSWTQEVPETTLRLIADLNLPKQARIIDVGGGKSTLAAALIKPGYTDVTVLDISSVALEKTKAGLDSDADKVQWVQGNILDFKITKPYDLWLDRAAFHFLHSEAEIARYVQLASNGITEGGSILLSVFDRQGPETCSGLPVNRYRASELCKLFEHRFNLRRRVTELHYTPAGAEQSFLYTLFTRRPVNDIPVHTVLEETAVYKNPMAPHCSIVGGCCC